MPLHAVWHNSSLQLFADQEGAQGFAAHASLRDLVGELSPDGLLATAATASTLPLFLPHTEQGPLTSSTPTDPNQTPHLAPAEVPTLNLTPDQTIDFLTTLPPACPCGDSIRYFQSLVRFVLDRIAARQFFPDLDQPRAAEYVARWRLLAHNETDLKHLETFAAAMPPVCRAVATGEPLDPSHILDTVLGATTDAFIRRAARSDEFFNRPQILAANPATASPDVRWLAALLSDDAQVKGPADENAFLFEHVRAWVARLDEGRPNAPWTLQFVLEEPDFPTEDEDPNNPITDAPWTLLLQLRAPATEDNNGDDATTVIDADELWSETSDPAGLFGRNLADRRAQLVADLAKASEICPLLSKLLESPTPSSLTLSTAEAHALIRQWATPLIDAGFGLILPDWATRRDRGLGLLLSVRPTEPADLDDESSPFDDPSKDPSRANGAFPPESAPGRFGLESLLDFDWQIAVGDLRLSPTEFTHLASKGATLLRYKGRWVQLDPNSAQKTVDFLQKNAAGKMTLAQAFRTAYGLAPAAADAGLPIIGLSGSDWIDRLLSQTDNTNMPKLPQPGNFTGELRPYQLRGLEWLSFLDRVGLGACLADDMGLGKAQPLTAKLLTPTGWKLMADIRVGDQVIGSNGQPTRVTGVYPQGPRQVFRVTFSDGAATECCDEHLWHVTTPVRRYRGQPGRVLPLSEIRTRLKDSSDNALHFIPMVAPVEFDRRAELPLHPYLLGVLLGDGGIAHRTILSSADQDLLERVASLLPPGVALTHTGSGVDYRISSGTPDRDNPVTTALRRLELHGLGSHDKFIPDLYKFAPAPHRLELLRGLLDTDGHVRPNDNNIEFCTTSKRLAEDVQFLVQSFGGTAPIREKTTDHRLAYRMSIALPGDTNPFWLPRKANVYHPREKYPPARAIVSVDPIGTQPVQCIAVDAPDHLYVTDDFILTHNTIQLIGLLLHERQQAQRAAQHATQRVHAHTQAGSQRSEGPDPSVHPSSFILHPSSSPLPGPTLLFAPTSVVGNWLRELARFAPTLKVLLHHGPDRLAGDDFVNAATKSDVVVTTYALAHRDLADLRRPRWYRVALDEAQKIKNPAAAASIAIRSIPAPRRVALTGTPVENHLSELWSIMELLNPGLLGPAGEFREKFAVPIEKLGDRDRAFMLRRMIQPFVLRRTKSDPQISGDLPEKMEMKVYCNLTPEQAALYERITAEMLGQIDSATGIRRRGLILAALTRLKQICDHPVLLEKDDNAPLAPLDKRSGKCERIIEMLEEVLEEGDAALVFSQYREMGHLLERLIADRLRAPTLFLHGGTPAKQRDAMIERFQAPGSDVKIFILSLRAGGLGLNLTAANHVFHFDRWWNPAVEAQATDRAHRIGQTRKVQVHQFVCVGTLEERIDKLLTDKLALADQVVGSGDEWLTNLSTDQLRQYLALSKDAVSEF